MPERVSGKEGGFDWKKSKLLRAGIVGVLGIGLVVALLG